MMADDASLYSETNVQGWSAWRLPGLLSHAEQRAPGRIDTEVYLDLLADRWGDLLDSGDARAEKLLHAFFERHPCLLPGAYTVDRDSGHSPYPRAVISKPSLPGIGPRTPDFMWIATDSEAVYPILVEIETPEKKWFYGDRAEIHSDFTHAQGQLAEWRAWFRKGHNVSAFADLYQLPDYMRDRAVQPRFILIHGRRADYEGDKLRQAKRAELRREDERLMSFDRLFPDPKAVHLGCVRMGNRGYTAHAVSPAFVVIWGNATQENGVGWEDALQDCPDMAEARKLFLISKLQESAEFRLALESKTGLRAYRPTWL